MSPLLCSLTGERCECAAGEGCAAKVRHARKLLTAQKDILAAQAWVGDVVDEMLRSRRDPGPRLRQVVRSLGTSWKDLNEIIKELNDSATG